MGRAQPFVLVSAVYRIAPPKVENLLLEVLHLPIVEGRAHQFPPVGEQQSRTGAPTGEHLAAGVRAGQPRPWNSPVVGRELL